MAANPKKGNYGKLANPSDRERDLRRLAQHYTLEEAGLHLGLGKERMRQLYFIYGIRRERRRKSPGTVVYRGHTLQRVAIQGKLVPRSCLLEPNGQRNLVWQIAGDNPRWRDCFFPSLRDAKRAVDLLSRRGDLTHLYARTNPV
jgi:hypothetical protein